MNILSLIRGNLRRGTLTQRYPARRAPAPEYRGFVVLDAAACRSCSKCAQVCVSAAITFERVEGDRYEWAYDPARCTFCGVCVAYCPVKCLAQEPDRSAWCTVPGEQAETLTVVKQRRKKAPRAAVPPPPEPVPVAEPVPTGEGADRGC